MIPSMLSFDEFQHLLEDEKEEAKNDATPTTEAGESETAQPHPANVAAPHAAGPAPRHESSGGETLPDTLGQSPQSGCCISEACRQPSCLRYRDGVCVASPGYEPSEPTYEAFAVCAGCGLRCVRRGVCQRGCRVEQPPQPPQPLTAAVAAPAPEPEPDPGEPQHPPCGDCGKPTAGYQTSRCPDCAEALLCAIEDAIQRDRQPRVTATGVYL